MNWDLRLGDCLAPDAMPSLADKSVDHVICDPPFENEAHTLQRRVKRGNGNGGDAMESEPLPFPPITEAQRVESCVQFSRLARRWVLVFCQVEASHKWRAAGEAAGLVYRRTCIWVKPDGMPQFSGDRPGMGYETIVAMHAPGRSTWNGGGRHGVFIVNKAAAPGGNDHPTQKPIKLMDLLVGLFTDPGELILDPFAGSGTTGSSCLALGRRFLGWELDEKYHAIAQQRLAGTRQLPVAFQDGRAQGALL